MERLWSPWRLSYVTGAERPKRDGCIFCDAGALSTDADRDLIVARSRLAYVLLNRFPYNNGHLMIAPQRHIASLQAATPDELSEIVQLMRRAEMALSEAYKPEGINVGINLGRPAGAGIVDHLHVHLVPRWTGDTSFISVIGQVRVLPEELDQTASRLRPIFERLSSEQPAS